MLLEELIVPLIMDTTKFEKGSEEAKQHAAHLKQELLGIAQTAIGITSVTAVLGILANTMKDSVVGTIAYANSVRDLSLASGTTAEESSRLIQVLSDFKITSDDLLRATRKLTDNGLAPTVQTIAKLSKQYNSLNTVQERNDFIVKNLDKDTAKWHQLLSKGEQSILAMNDAIDENLVLTEEQLQQAREAEVAWDNWNDSIDAVKTQFAVGVIPAITELLNIVNAYSVAQNEQVATWEKLIPPIGIVHGLYLALTDTEQDAAVSAMAHSDALKNVSNEAIQTQEDLALLEQQIKDETRANMDFLSTVGSLTSSLQNYHQRQADLDQQYAEGKITLQEYQTASKELADQREIDSKRMILSMLQERLAFDGLTDAEMEGLLDLGVQWGVYSAEAVAEAKNAIAQADYLAKTLQGMPEEKTIDIFLNSHLNPTGQPVGRANGGQGIAGQAYHVSEFHQPEIFIPQTNGRFERVSNLQSQAPAQLDEDKLARLFASLVQQAIGG